MTFQVVVVVEKHIKNLKTMLNELAKITRMKEDIERERERVFHAS